MGGCVFSVGNKKADLAQGPGRLLSNASLVGWITCF